MGGHAFLCRQLRNAIAWSVVFGNIAITLHPGSAVANPEGPASEAQARAHAQKAADLAAKGDHRGAAAYWHKAYVATNKVGLLKNVALEFEQAGDDALAVRYHCELVTQAPSHPLAAESARHVIALKRQQGITVDAMAPCRTDAETLPTGTTDDIGATGLVRTPPNPNHQAAADGQAAGPANGSPALRVAGLTSIAVGVVGVAIGGYYAKRGNDYAAQIDTHDPSQPWTATEYDIHKRLGPNANRNAYIGFGVGGGLIATGAVLWMVGRAKPSSERPRITIAPPSPSSMMAFISGSF